jgi:hypothetical protein
MAHCCSKTLRGSLPSFKCRTLLQKPTMLSAMLAVASA